MCYVMIVDNNMDNYLKIQSEIQQHFVNIVLLPDIKTGAEALSLAKKQLVEILIINLELADVDSFTLINELTRLHPNLRTIVTSEQASFTAAQQALRIGAIDYLLHPLDETFLHAVDRAIQSIHHISLYNKTNPKRIINLTAPNSATQQMLLYVREHYQHNISLQDLAEHMHLNHQYTSKCFKEQVGMNFITYLVHLRIEEAKRLLSTTKHSITAIALSVGYQEPSYFSKLFKKQTGFTPQAYRKLFKGQRYILDQNAVGC